MTGGHKHRIIAINHARLHSADKEVVLVHVYLDTGCSSVEILEGLCTMLRKRVDGEGVMEGKWHTPVRASILGRLYDRHDRISSGSPFRKFHSIYQLPLESECATGQQIAI